MNSLHVYATGDVESPQTTVYTPKLSLPRLTCALPHNLPPLDASLNGACCLTEAEINAQILFPSRTNSFHSLKTSVTSDPQLDQELNSLKQSILSQKDVSNEHQEKLFFQLLDGLSCDHTTLSNTSPDLLRSLPGFSCLAGSSTFSSAFTLRRTAEGRLMREARVGLYSALERQRKIRRYKEKLKTWRAHHPISRKFDGRRRVAFVKNRLNGRFSKLS